MSLFIKFREKIENAEASPNSAEQSSFVRKGEDPLVFPKS